MGKQGRYPQELRERAVRMVQEHRGEYTSLWQATQSIAGKFGMHQVTLYEWVKRAEIDAGQRAGLSTSERERLKQLVRENPRAAESQRDPQERLSFLRDRARRSTTEMTTYIDAQRERYGVEPICTVLQFAPATYYAAKARPASARSLRDEELKVEIMRIWSEHRRVYGADKVWAQLRREGVQVARCTIERLMRDLGIRGVVRGKIVRTTFPDAAATRPADLVDRQFRAAAPNRLWVADLTYVKTHRRLGVCGLHRRRLLTLCGRLAGVALPAH